ncbi:MAG: tRNA adenosine(34) deaminase TadA [Nitrospirota bacterium]
MNERDQSLMALALEEAREAASQGDVPIGAVVACNGEVVSRAHNEREMRRDPTAHAELLALRAASAILGRWRLFGCTLYVTLEPCAMCAGALVLARLDRVIYGCDDPKAGACGSTVDLLRAPHVNHRMKIARGVLAEECGQLLKDFFAARRDTAAKAEGSHNGHNGLR